MSRSDTAFAAQLSGLQVGLFSIAPLASGWLGRFQKLLGTSGFWRFSGE